MQKENSEQAKKKLTGNEKLEKPCCSGVKPKVKHQVPNCVSTSSHSNNSILNGCTSSIVNKSNINGTSCSSLVLCSPLLSSSSSSSLNSDVDTFDKNVLKNRTLPFEEKNVQSKDKKRKTVNVLENENSSGNEGDEGLSGDDCCIYTYKGDQFADLPNSLFPADLLDGEGEQKQRENHREPSFRRPRDEAEYSDHGSSPEMDYLEMDFDPGPSLEQDSEDDIDSFEIKPTSGAHTFDHENETVSLAQGVSEKNVKSCENSEEPKPGPSNENFYMCFLKSKLPDYNSNVDQYNRTKGSFDCCYGGYTFVDNSNQNCNFNGGESRTKKLESELDNFSVFPSSVFEGRRLDRQYQVLNLQQKDFNDLDVKTPFDGIMLWSEQEAISKEVPLVSSGVSCGVIAVINVMLALKMKFSIEKVKEGISNRLRSDSLSIPQYLVSSSFAGVAHENLIRGIHHASQGTLYARFFQMYPRRDIMLSKWLFHWIKKGAIPIATMNVQRDNALEPSSQDTRQHQMIFGVTSKGIYMTNPLECVKEDDLWSRLTNPSVLVIKKQEIISRWSPDTNLKPLMYQTDDRWKAMNVLGQVVNLIRESADIATQGKSVTPHIIIPASSGITLVIPRESVGYDELVSSKELPVSS